MDRCLEAGEDGESHMDALLSLGISYTNELNQSRALDYLKRWMDGHPQVNPKDENSCIHQSLNPIRSDPIESKSFALILISLSVRGHLDRL